MIHTNVETVPNRQNLRQRRPKYYAQQLRLRRYHRPAYAHELRSPELAHGIPRHQEAACAGRGGRVLLWAEGAGQPVACYV